MRPVIALAILAACLAIPAMLGSYPYYSGIAVYAVVLALFGISVNLTVGYLGYVSFGHAAFFGLGAYTAALLTLKLGMNFWLALFIAPIPAAALGALVGFASLRVGGAYFAIATLTVSEILHILAANLTGLTRGQLGLIVPRPRVAFLDGLGIGFQQYYLAFALLALALVVFCLLRLLTGPIGSAWAVIKESARLGESVGIPTLRYRILNVTLSGALAGFAGALLIPRTSVIVPEVFASDLSATGLLVAILGGKATLLGPILGGLTFAALPEALRFIDEYRMAIFALILLVVVRAQPSGLVAFLPARLRRQSRAPQVGETDQLVFEQTQELEVEALSKNFGGLHAVKGARFKFMPGEVVGIIGPNGAGKTTCLSLISGFMRPTTGTIKLGGETVKGLAPNRLAGFGLVRTFQETAVCGNLSCFENVIAAVPHHEGVLSSVIRGAAYRQRETARQRRAFACLRLFGLAQSADVMAGSMPHGDQKMLSVAIAVAAQPRLLLLDEPAAGLNHTEARRLSDLLLQLRARGLTIVLIDHNLKMMMAVCDRIYVLDRGGPLAEGTPAEVRTNPAVVEAYLGTSRKQEAVDAVG